MTCASDTCTLNCLRASSSHCVQAGNDAFFSATGVTDGDVLQGVRYRGDRSASTESLVMRSRSGTVRRIFARHDRAKMRAIGISRYG